MPPPGGINPLTCTIFDPDDSALFLCHIPYSGTGHSSLFWDILLHLSKFAPNRAELPPAGHLIHFFQIRAHSATRSFTGGTALFCLTFIMLQDFAVSEGNNGHSGTQLWLLSCKLRDFAKLLWIFFDLLIRKRHRFSVTVRPAASCYGHQAIQNHFVMSNPRTVAWCIFCIRQLIRPVSRQQHNTLL